MDTAAIKTALRGVIKNPQKEIKQPLPGTEITIVACQWREPQWEFDFPSLLVYPFFSYESNGVHNDALVEDAGIDLVCKDIIKSVDITDWAEFYGWDINKLIGYCIDRLSGKKKAGDRMYPGLMVLYANVRFYNDKYNELAFKITEQIEI